MKTKVPIWLQLVLGVFSILAPQFAWIRVLIELAWELFSGLPLLQKPKALKELRKAVKQTKAMKEKNYVSDKYQEPIMEWHSKWQPKRKKK